MRNELIESSRLVHLLSQLLRLTAEVENVGQFDVKVPVFILKSSLEYHVLSLLLLTVSTLYRISVFQNQTRCYNLTE